MPRPSKPLHIALLGDVHGHLTLAYRVLKRWEHETGHTLDLILQVGDLGAYPPPFRVDKATMRFAEKDPDELGFADYYAGNAEVDAILGPDAVDVHRIDADLVFIKGNHEDFVFLHEVQEQDQPVGVDANGRIRYLATGIWTWERDGHVLRIGALGGIADRQGPGHDPISMHYTRGEVGRLRKRGYDLDILLTHDVPRAAAHVVHPKYADSGSSDIADLIRALEPRFHFCGHYHEPGQALDVAEATRSYILNTVAFHRPRRLNPGCVGILTWPERASARFEVLDAPWLAEFDRWNFRSLPLP